MAEDSTGEVRYLLSDGLGSVRQAVDALGSVAVYHEFDPYGNPVQNGGDPYGYSGEWWQAEAGLLHLRARWYAPEVGIFLSRDAVEGEPPYAYVRGNPVNWVDPSGEVPIPDCGDPRTCKVELQSLRVGSISETKFPFGHLGIIFTNLNGDIYFVEARPGVHVIDIKNDPPGNIIIQDIEDQESYAIREMLPSLRKNPETIIITVDEGEDICDKWACLVNQMRRIASMKFRYKSLEHNSNAAAYTTLKACGLPTSGPQYNTSRSHPGWGIDLFAPRPVPVPTPPPMSVSEPISTPEPPNN